MKNLSGTWMAADGKHTGKWDYRMMSPSSPLTTGGGGGVVGPSPPRTFNISSQVKIATFNEER